MSAPGWRDLIRLVFKSKLYPHADIGSLVWRALSIIINLKTGLRQSGHLQILRACAILQVKLHKDTLFYIIELRRSLGYITFAAFSLSNEICRRLP